MATVSTGLNTHFPSVNAFKASSPITTIPPSTASLSLQQYPLQRFPRLSVLRPSHISEKARTSRRRQPMRLVCSIKKLAETEAIPLEENPRSLSEKLPYATGVYAMHDKSGELQFIGISRMVADSVLNHLRDVPQLCGSVKIAVFDATRHLALIDPWKFWMDEHIKATGEVPPGNESWNITWMEKERPVKSDLWLKPDHYMSFSLPLEQLVEKLLNENEILVFIKGSRTDPKCPQSYRVLKILYEQMVDYETIDVFDEVYNRGVRKALKAYSDWPTFPQVFVRGNLIGGADELDKMADKGELYELFKK